MGSLPHIWGVRARVPVCRPVPRGCFVLQVQRAELLARVLVGWRELCPRYVAADVAPPYPVAARVGPELVGADPALRPVRHVSKPRNDDTTAHASSHPPHTRHA